MSELEKIVLENKDGFLATLEDGRPRIRPFQIQFIVDGRYYLCTANTKEVYKQLVDFPYFEFSTVTKDNVFVRIRGKAVFDTDAVLKQRVMDENELVRSIYKTGDNPTFEIFYIDEGVASIAALDGSPTRIYNLTR